MSVSTSKQHLDGVTKNAKSKVHRQSSRCSDARPRGAGHASRRDGRSAMRGGGRQPGRRAGDQPVTPRQLRRVAARTPVRAHIVSDGCRDYVVEVVSSSGAGLLRHRRGNSLTFRSLADACRLLSRCGVDDAVLRHRVAHDEACALKDPAFGTGFHDLPLAMGR